jgi:hypothetical protein
MSGTLDGRNLLGFWAGPFIFGGADGIRTHDLLDAIEARSQLRHGPTGLTKFTTGPFFSTAVPPPRPVHATPGPLYKSYLGCPNS